MEFQGSLKIDVKSKDRTIIQNKRIDLETEIVYKNSQSQNNYQRVQFVIHTCTK